MKKGFTLVELLAVIVILSIILAIAIPTIGNLIANSKKSMFENSSKMILRSMKNDYDGKIASTGAFADTFVLYDNGVRTVYPSSNTLDFTISATDGGIVRHSDGTVTMALWDGTNCSVKTRTSNDVTVTTTDKATCVANIYYKQASAPFTNLVTNGDFSDGKTGWTTDFTVDSTLGKSGASSLRFVNNGSKTGYLNKLVSGSSLDKYYTSAWINAQSITGGADYNLAIYINNSNIAQTIGIGTSYLKPNILNAWQRLATIITGVSGDAGFYYRMYSHIAVCVVNVDDVVVLNLTSLYGVGNEPTKEQMEHNLNKVWIDTTTNAPKGFTAGGWINY